MFLAGAEIKVSPPPGGSLGVASSRVRYPDLLKECVCAVLLTSVRVNVWVLGVQNNAARLILRTTKCADVTAPLYSLHWFPVEQKIEYTISLLCFTIINDQAPIYLSDHLQL